MPQSQNFAAAMHPPMPTGHWSFGTADADEGPGMLVSPAFWIGGGLSLLLWGCITVLAVQWL